MMTNRNANSNTNDFMFSQYYGVDTFGQDTDHIFCLIPTYIDGGDSTECYYVDGRREIIHKPVMSVIRSFVKRGVLMVTNSTASDGDKALYTAPRTYGPNTTFARLKVRRSIGRGTVYGLFNVIVPDGIAIYHSDRPNRSYVQMGDFEPIMVLHAPKHVSRKLYEAKLEHTQYVHNWFSKLCGSHCPQVISELYTALRHMIH